MHPTTVLEDAPVVTGETAKGPVIIGKRALNLFSSTTGSPSRVWASASSWSPPGWCQRSVWRPGPGCAARWPTRDVAQARDGPSAPAQGQCLFYHLLPTGAATLSEWKQRGGWSLSPSPLKAPELRGPGSWSLLSPGRSCGLAVISHVLSSVDILPPIHASTHMCTHVHTHTLHTRRLFITDHPSLARPGSFLTAALVLLGRGGLTWVIWLLAQSPALPSGFSQAQLPQHLGENSPGLEAPFSVLPAFPGS